MRNLHYHDPVVIFDLDDTLFRERDFCRSGFRMLLQKLEERIGSGPEDLYEAMNEALVKRENPFAVYEKICRPLYERKGEKFDIDEIIADYRAHTPENLRLADGVESTLEALSEKGIVMGLITDGRSLTQRNKIKALGLERFFEDENILISEETGNDKMSREPFVTFVRRYPEASGFVYIGDNPAKDFYHPNRLGWLTVMVPDNSDNVHRHADSLETPYLPKIEIKDFSEIPNVLNRISKNF